MQEFFSRKIISNAKSRAKTKGLRVSRQKNRKRVNPDDDTLLAGGDGEECNEIGENLREEENDNAKEKDAENAGIEKLDAAIESNALKGIESGPANEWKNLGTDNAASEDTSGCAVSSNISLFKPANAIVLENLVLAAVAKPAEIPEDAQREKEKTENVKRNLFAPPVAKKMKYPPKMHPLDLGESSEEDDDDVEGDWRVSDITDISD